MDDNDITALVGWPTEPGMARYRKVAAAAEAAERDRWSNAAHACQLLRAENATFRNAQRACEHCDPAGHAAAVAAERERCARRPLADDDVLKMWRTSDFRGSGGQADWFAEGVRAAERAHGIEA